ncbi:DUF4190 domain-containing protein [Subtercola sp. YIM 133946]|uniref:DUF4190 domain-containing protein n=1 Tax=Subtercola sp. YIM 133946 TaxID=3118909 RepID=UPI002F940626
MTDNQPSSPDDAPEPHAGPPTPPNSPAGPPASSAPPAGPPASSAPPSSPPAYSAPPASPPAYSAPAAYSAPPAYSSSPGESLAGPVQGRPPFSGMAIAGFAISCVSLFIFGFLGIVGLLLSVAALRRIRTGVARGRGLAIAGLVIGAVAAIFYLVGLLLRLGS